MKCMMTVSGVFAASVVTVFAAGELEWYSGGEGPAYVFGSSTSPLASASMAVPAGQSADSVSVTAGHGAALTFTGGPLVLGSGGSISLSGCASLLLDLPITASGPFSVGGSNESVTMTDLYPAKYSADDPTTEMILLENASLEDYEVSSAHLKSAWLDVDVYPCHVRRSEGSLVAQLQCFEPNWIRCVKVQLVQKDSDIALRLIYARQARVEHYPLGSDFDLASIGSDASAGFALEYNIARSATGTGCAIRDMTLEKTGRTGVVFNSAAVGADTVTVAGGAKAVLSGSGSFKTSAGTTPALEVDGVLEIGDRSETLTLAGLAGSGGRIDIAPSAAVSEPFELKFGDSADAGHLVMTELTQLTSDIVLGAVTNVTDVWISTGNKVDVDGVSVDERLLATIACYSNNGAVASFQAQVWQSPFIKCCVIELTQDSGAVKCRVSYRGYYKGSEDLLGNDFFMFEGRTDDRGNYYPNTLTLQLEDKVCNETVLAGESTQLDATINVGACRRLVLGAKNCLPVRGVVNVGAGGEIVTASASEIRERGDELTEYSQRGGTLVNVLPGGVFRQKHAHCFNRFLQRFSVDGGEFAFSRVSLQNNVAYDSGCYVNFMTLSGGARLTGMRPRVGALNDAAKESVWRIRRGTSGETVSHECGLMFIGNGYNQPFVVDIEEFADGCEFVSVPGRFGAGSFGNWAGGSATQNMKLVKRGNGGWLVKTSNPDHRGELIVEAGELVLGVDKAFAEGESGACASVTLAGGTLTAAEGTFQPLSALAVTGEATLKIEDGARVAFADSSSLSWSGNLDVTCTLEKDTLRFGDGNGALTVGQVRRIRVNGRRVSLDDSGFVKVNYGLKVLVK